MSCINDSKATSFDACLQSLSNLNEIYWIVGGQPKAQDNFNLKKITNKIIKAYIIGRHTSFFSKQIEQKVPYKISYTLKNAIQNIYEDIKNRKVNKKYNILFSPGAASFDQFKNFEDRGNRFKYLIIKKFKKK